MGHFILSILTSSGNTGQGSLPAVSKVGQAHLVAGRRSGPSKPKHGIPPGFTVGGQIPTERGRAARDWPANLL